MCVGGMQILHATPFYIKDLSIHGLKYLHQSWNQSPMDTEG